MVILQETAVLAMVCLADLMWTMWLLATGMAVEANPILRFYLDRGGLTCFMAAKVLLFAGPLLGLELLRCRRPEFTRTLMRAAIVVYLASYTIGVLHINAPAMVRAAHRATLAHRVALHYPRALTLRSGPVLPSL